MSETFVMKWPELGKQVRVRAIEQNQDVFKWFVENLPVRALQGHNVVAGYILAAQDVGFKKSFPWRERNLSKEDGSRAPVGRCYLYRTAGKAGNVGVKWGESTEPLGYATWAEVFPEDASILVEVGKQIWANTMGIQKPLVHVEFVKSEE